MSSSVYKVDNKVDNFISLIQKLADYEAEINILEELILDKYSKDGVNEDLVKDLTNTKTQYTKLKNKLDRIIEKEQD